MAKFNRKRKNKPENPQVKAIRQLRSRQEREQTGTYYIEGNRIVAQAVQTGAIIEQGVIAPDVIMSDQVWETVNSLKEAGVPLLEMDSNSFSRISFKRNLHGIGAVVRPQVETLATISMENAFNWVALDHVGNPGNLGAILRTCDAVGCPGIIMLDDTVDPYHPAAVRASMGAVFSLRMVRASFTEFVSWKAEHHIPVVGTSDKAEASYREVAYPTPCILLMGSERIGLTDEKQAICDQVVRIPMVGTSDSLNLAVATSVVLYEIFHQYQQHGA